MCCDLSLRGPKHAQQRTTPQDRGVLLVSREEGQGFETYLGCNGHTRAASFNTQNNPPLRVAPFICNTEI